MPLWQCAFLGRLFFGFRLRGALALHLHGDGSGEGEGDLPEGREEPFGQLRAALRAAQTSLDAEGKSASDLRDALRRAVGSVDTGSLDSAEGGPLDSWDESSYRARYRASGYERGSEDGRIPAKSGRYQGGSTLLQGVPTVLEDEVEMLSDSQKERLRAIQNGSIGKDRIEIVLARYDELTGWSRMYRHIISPYCKGPIETRDCRRLPNVGREAHTFLHHIIENYDKLADWTVFSQAQAPTVGAGKSGDRDNGHMYPGVTFHDYVLGGGPFSGDGGDSQGARFVFNGHWKAPRLKSEVNYYNTANYSGIRMCFAGNYLGAMRKAGAPERLNTTCPTLKSKESQIWLNADSVNQAFLAYIDAIGASSESKFFYSQGARFALSRERIQQRPRQFYQNLLGTVDYEADPVGGFFAELLWYYIPGRPDQHRRPCMDRAFQACPKGFERLGSMADHAEEGILRRLLGVTIAGCAAACSAEPSCESFEYHAHRPKACVLQPGRNSAEEAQSGFWAGAIACRRAGARRS